MKEYDYILFDLDGTLTDSKPGIVKCIAYALEKEKIPYTQGILDKMVGPPFRVSMKEYFGLDMPMIEKLIEIYRGVRSVGLQKLQGLRRRARDASSIEGCGQNPCRSNQQTNKIYESDYA